jgi:spore coat polysaccharide biosynthesis protein SpsF
MQTVLIAIQARSNNSRLPGKCMKEINGKPIVKHTIDACQRSAEHINRTTYNHNTRVDVCLVVPEGDNVFDQYESPMLDIFKGSETDVLSRYRKAVLKAKPRYLVRITSDCPMLPPSLITKHIKTAVRNRLDYVSNVDPLYRTSPDGYDVEVVSIELLDWLFKSAKSDHDKEHVTTYIRSHTPSWARIGLIMSQMDLSDLKFAVDTQEEFDRVRLNMESISEKYESAKKRGISVYKF